MERRGTRLRRVAPAVRWRLILLWLQEQALIRGWLSEILLRPGEVRPSLAQVLGAAQPSSLLLLCLPQSDWTALRVANRELLHIFRNIIAFVTAAAVRLQRAYLA